MTIRITLPDGETIETSRHTLEQAQDAQGAAVKILVGGIHELNVADFEDDNGNSTDPDVPEERVIDLTGATIEQVSA